MRACSAADPPDVRARAGHPDDDPDRTAVAATAVDGACRPAPRVAPRAGRWGCERLNTKEARLKLGSAWPARAWPLSAAAQPAARRLLTFCFCSRLGGRMDVLNVS